MKNLLNRLSYGIFILLLVGVTALFLTPSLPFKSSVEVKIVKSGSMEPAIKTGSVIVVKPANTYAVGDIITFGEDTPTTFPTTHRITAIKNVGAETFYEVKGDANEEIDPSLVNSQEVIGKVILTIPNAGYILDFARQPMGFVLLIAFPAALVILNELIDITREVRRTLRRRRNNSDELEKNITRKRVLKKISRMDDVSHPVYLVHKVVSKKRRDPIIAGMIIFFMSGIFFTNTGDTSSYFSDEERSLGNTLSAMSFEISARALPGESYVGHSGSSNIISTITPNPVGLPNEYKVTVEKLAGSDAFCQALILTSTSTPPFAYNGPLLQFASPPTIYSGDWSFEVTLDPNVEVVPEDKCAVNLIYTASTWLEDKGVHAGYSDVEKVTLIFETSEYDVEETQTYNLNNVPISAEGQAEEVTSTTTEESAIEEEATSTPPIVEELEEAVEEEQIEPEIIKEVVGKIIEETVEEVITEEPVVVEENLVEE